MVDHLPVPRKEAVRPLDTSVVPLGVLLGWADEERVKPHRVGPIPLDQGVRGDHVSLGLRHLVPGLGDHPLREEALERLGEGDHPDVPEDLHDEPRVKQVEDGVLDSPDVLVDREPPIHCIR